MFAISSDAATTLYNWSYIGLITAGVIGLISTGVAFWTNGIKEDASKKEIAALNLKAEELRQKNLQAERQLVQLRIDQGPRSSKFMMAQLAGNGTEGLSGVLKANPVGEVMIWHIPNDPEAEGFARDLWFALKAAGWKTNAIWEAIPPGISALEDAALQRARDEKRNFGLVPIDGKTPLLVATRNGFDLKAPGAIPAKALFDGLLKCGFAVATGTSPVAPPDVVLLVIGQKQ